MPTGVRFPSGIFVAQGDTGTVTPGGNGAATISLINGEAGALAAGDVCYFFSNTAAKKAFANGTLEQASASLMAAEAIAPGIAGLFVLSGVVLAAGAAQVFNTLGYLSNTPGLIAAVPNLTAGEYNVLLGAWINATDFDFNKQLPILN